MVFAGKSFSRAAAGWNIGVNARIGGGVVEPDDIAAVAVVCPNDTYLRPLYLVAAYEQLVARVIAVPSQIEGVHVNEGDIVDDPSVVSEIVVAKTNVGTVKREADVDTLERSGGQGVLGWEVWRCIGAG